jgi:hypothetical protein
MKCHTRIHRAFALLVALALGACQATHQYTTPSKIVTLAAGEAKSFQIVARSSREQALDARTARGPGTKARRGARRRYCHALVIENNTYVDLPKLGTAPADAERIAGVLNRQYDYTVTLLRDATRDQIFDAFDRLRRELGEDDNLLIYYAGRGWLDPDADCGYWLPVDARWDTRSRWLSNGDITDLLRATKARQVMVVADSCYSGTLTRGIKIGSEGSGYLKNS